MSSRAETSQLTTKKKVNFARLSRIVIDLFARILRDILIFYYKCPEDLQRKMIDIHLEHKFKNDMDRVLEGGDYEKCDVSLLHRLIRSTCPILPPTPTRMRRGWGADKFPTRECTSVGDDMERIRIIRNRACGHIHSTEVEDNVLEKYLSISHGICERLRFQYGTKDYIKELETIQHCRMEDDMLVTLTEKVKEDIERNEELLNYAMKDSKKLDVIDEKVDKILEMTKSKSEHSTKSESFFSRNSEGKITSLTDNGWKVIERNSETDPEQPNREMSEVTSLIINAIITNLCRSEDGMNLQRLEIHFRDIFHDSFKSKIGTKLLEYLRKNTDQFRVYRVKGSQWKVTQTVCKSYEKSRRQRKSKQNKSQTKNKQPRDQQITKPIRVEEFNIKNLYPHQEFQNEETDQTHVTLDVYANNKESFIAKNYSDQELQSRDPSTHLQSDDRNWDDDDLEFTFTQEIIFAEEEKELNSFDHQRKETSAHPTDTRHHEGTNFSNRTQGTIPVNFWTNSDRKETGCKRQCKSVPSELQTLIYSKEDIGTHIPNKHPPEMFKKQARNDQLGFPSSMEDTLSQFLEKVHNFEKTSESFVLVVGKTEILPKIESLALIPWLCVFDFDMSSREDGLMSVLDGHIRTIHPCTLKDRPRFSFSYTYWCQLRGDSQVPDTCIKSDVKSWMKLVKSDLEEHLETLSRYISNNTIMTVILLWPTDDDDMRFINRFLIKMEEIVEPSPEIFVIYPSLQCESPYMSQIEPAFKLQVPLGYFYTYLKTNLKCSMPRRPARYRLPTYDKSNDPGIDDFTASHLEEDLNILYLHDTQRSGYDVYEIKEEGENFLRGGTLRWFVYYENDDAGYFDVKRDQMNKILHDIRQVYINRSLSAIVKVYHSPGAGGTTLSQRILWELHKEIPCVQVKSNFQSTTSDIAEHIKLLFEKTHLPILILLDGRDESEVRHLYKQLRLQSISVIILHVQRLRQEPKDKMLETGKYWMEGHVSKREANQFCMRYLEFCDTEEKRLNLETITDNVAKGELHQVYEFGLTTFAHLYRGVDAYVKGYLQLQTMEPLDVTQKLLGYLSLIYFYGQMSVPCELFSKLLNKRKGITFEDLPFVVRQLVVKSNNHQHVGFIRICHQIVAKEILEQILTRNVQRLEKPSSQNLSQEACRNLADFGVEFIKDMKAKHEGKSGWSKNIIVEILTKTFLHRDQDIDELNFQRKPKFSRFFIDIEKHTSKRDRIRIMENITSCFPQNPNYHAHLGRMYSLYFPGEDDIAEKHFKKAVSLCEKEHKTVGKEGNCAFRDYTTHSSVYHMFGMHFYHRICRATKESNEVVVYNQNVETVVEFARNACLHFETAYENVLTDFGELYGLTGEIMVRCTVCNYINKNLDVSLPEFITSPMSPVTVFVRESMVHICELITRCYSAVDKDELPPSMSHFVNLYKELFKGQEITQLCSFDGPLDYTRRRHVVTQIKLKYDIYDVLSLNNKTPSGDIHDIVHNLEGNFMDLEIKGTNDLNKRSFERDFKDWVNAIRLNQYDKDVQLEEVRRRVNQWHELTNTPTSKFYVFVTCTLLTILKKDMNCYIEARDMLEEVKKHRNYFLKPFKPKEWLGISSGIKCLISGLFLKPRVDCSVNEVEIDNGHDVRPKYLKGTIFGSNKRPFCGTICLDVCNGSQFDVSFVPNRTKEKLVGSTYSNQRVEFILGFNASHGFTAYNVKRLETVPCESCPRKVEFVTDQNIAVCKCGKNVQKLKAEEVFYPKFD